MKYADHYKATRYLPFVLAALDKYGVMHCNDIGSEAQLGKTYVFAVLRYGRDIGLLSPTFRGYYVITERGKVALAIWRGKRTRKRWQMRMDSNHQPWASKTPALAS